MTKKIASLETNQDQPLDRHNSTASSQRNSISKHLDEKGSLTTLYARERLGIMSPAARVLELRKNGHKIITHWTTSEDMAGTKHREAKYVLLAGGTN